MACLSDERVQMAAAQSTETRGLAPTWRSNTAASCHNEYNWQAYVPETTMSYLTANGRLAYHNLFLRRLELLWPSP